MRRIEKDIRACKKATFWDVHYSKRRIPIVALRCPFGGKDCAHAEKKEGRRFCNNSVLYETLRREYAEKKKKEAA